LSVITIKPKEGPEKTVNQCIRAAVLSDPGVTN